MAGKIRAKTAKKAATRAAPRSGAKVKKAKVADEVVAEKKPAPPPRKFWIVRFASDDHRVFLHEIDAVTCQSIYKGDGPFGPYRL